MFRLNIPSLASYPVAAAAAVWFVRRSFRLRFIRLRSSRNVASGFAPARVVLKRDRV